MLYILYISYIKIMFRIINSFTKINFDHKKLNQYLFVFDIDDTILHYGDINYVWFNQCIIENKLKYNTIQEALDQSVHEWFQKISSIEPLHTDEDGFKKLINKIKKKSYDYIFLTARNPKFSSITLHHFEKLGIPIEKNIYFTAGQNKGMILKEILENCNYNYNKIIFIDDSEKNLKDVHVELSNLYPIELYKFEILSV